MWAPFGIECEKYSSITKLIRVTAFALRLVERLKNPKYTGSTIASSDLNEAEQMWVKYIQRKNFSTYRERISLKSLSQCLVKTKQLTEAIRSVR